MIPALIIYLIRKYKGKSRSFVECPVSKKIIFKLLLILGIMLIVSSFTTPNTYKSLSYNVVKNNKVIGVININKSISQNEIVYTLNSDIKTKLLLTFNIVGKEKAIYKNGVLVYSSVYRSLNDKVKVDHSIKLQGDKYHITASNEITSMPFRAINHNLVTLYFNEPKGVDSIFCDNLKEMVAVKAIAAGAYRVEISNGKYNVFHYKNGKCIKVEAVSKLFSVTLIPVIS